jgi:L-threonate 2-dehydrogenase
MTRVAFVGLGSMGLPMATNLLRNGFAVTGFDVRQSAIDELVRLGGKAASSVDQAAAGGRYLILMVVHDEQAEDILFGAGALDALAADATVILMATCPPGSVQRMAERVLASGRSFIDAPVSGGVVGAKGASLTIMAAGPDAVVEAARPLLDALGSKIFHVGRKPGQGAAAKTVNQLLCGVHLAAAAEALCLAGRAGIDMRVMLEIVSGSSAASWMLNDRGPRMLQSDPELTSAVDIFVKDLGIVLQAGTSTKTALPLAAAAHQLFLAASGQGKGHLDDSQVIEAYRLLNGGRKPTV